MGKVIDSHTLLILIRAHTYICTCRFVDHRCAQGDARRYVWMYVCLYMYICICMFLYACMFMYAVCICMFLCPCVYMNACMHVYMYVFKVKRMSKRRSMYACVYVCVLRWKECRKGEANGDWGARGRSSVRDERCELLPLRISKMWCESTNSL